MSKLNLQTKALYNLFRLNWIGDPSIPCEPWQVEDLRNVSLDQLFQRLTKMGVVVSQTSLRHFADESSSPEQLAELLIGDEEDPKRRDAAYLVIFELWRRQFPERRSLSIFCDELDHRISLYYEGEPESDELIQDALSELKEIFIKNVDAGVSRSRIFEEISSYCAHDLMAFIIDFISSLLDAKNADFSSELIEDFASFATQLIWFDFLRARLIALTDSIRANQIVAELLKFDDKLTIDLLLEMLRFQVGYGERALFCATVKKIIPRLQAEEDFQELLKLSQDYFRRRDRADWEEAIQLILTRRQNLNGAIQSSDPDLKVFEELIKQMG
jgi:hypothetical protein